MKLKKIKIEGVEIITLNENISRELFEETFKIEEFNGLNQSNHYFDCGANTGVHLLKLKKYFPKIKVTCFEPTPENFSILKKNSSQFKDVITVNAAISKKKGKTKLYLDKKDSRGDSITKQWGSKRPGIDIINVKTILLSDYIVKGSWVKLDIEGEELNVMEDLESSSKIGLVKGFNIEVHTTNEDDCNKYLLIKNILKRNNFKIFIDREKEFEYMLPRKLIEWKRDLGSKVFILAARKK